MTDDNEEVDRPATDSVEFFQDLVLRWDRNSGRRAEELTHSQDSSYDDLFRLICSSLDLKEEHREKTGVLDAGCGLGFITSALSSLGLDVVGIDPSPKCIQFAQSRHAVGARGPQFKCCTLEDFVKLSTEGRFDIVLANMTLQSVPKLDSFLEAARRSLRRSGLFLATIPNPDSYLIGRVEGIGEEELSREQVFEVPFRIRGLADHPAKVWHFHRPLSHYLAALSRSEFEVTSIRVPKRVGFGRERDVLLLRSLAV